MFRTSPDRHRFGRLVAGLSVAAAVTGTTLLGAAPAYAATPVIASVSNGTLNIKGSSFGDGVVASNSNGAFTLSTTTGSITAGTGCQQLGTVVTCSGFDLMVFSGLLGDDTFKNDTSMRSFLSGGPGSDRITGGPGNDVIRGGDGSDFAFGRGGFDTCTAESESDCEA